MKLEFDEIYKRFFKDVYLFVLSMSKDPHTAEEITQDTFFKALKEIRHFQGKLFRQVLAVPDCQESIHLLHAQEKGGPYGQS